MANNPGLATLARMLMGHGETHRTPGPQLPFTGLTNTAGLPPYQQPGMSLDPAAYISTPAPAIPKPGAVVPPAGPPPAAPMVPPTSVQPGDQTLPSTMTQSATAADAMNPMAQAPSVWDTFKKMLAQGQVPEGYRGAMGEMIKNG